jgi:hypothetical protein
VLSLPLWAASVVAMGLALYLGFRQPGTPWTTLAAAAFVAGVSVFGFLMHMRFMFKPVTAPLYLSVDDAIARFGEDEEVTGVIDRSGRAWAYVARLARRPHLVYQNDGEAPFVMSHCILSHSSMAYELDERFTGRGVYVTSVLANNLVFYDRSNGCTVLQIENKARDDSLALKTLPTMMTSLGTWKRYYPESKVWYRPREWRDTFYLKLLARASVIDPASSDLVYPLERAADERLPLKSYVMGVHLEGEAKAYPLDAFREAPFVEDVVGGEPIGFFADETADFVQLYSRRLGERTLDFRAAGPGRFEDRGTGSTWTVTGECVAGELAGERLEPVPHYNKIFWCVWADFFPATDVHEQAADRAAA